MSCTRLLFVAEEDPGFYGALITPLQTTSLFTFNRKAMPIRPLKHNFDLIKE